ncbi:MAG: hypothetical protein H6676_09055 [Thermoflexaceae bacterium]|nr:hypothetical protein [Thermoflexaceae bacterium]
MAGLRIAESESDVDYFSNVGRSCLRRKAPLGLSGDAITMARERYPLLRNGVQDQTSGEFHPPRG